MPGTNQLILWNDLRLFYGTHPREVSKHSHPVVQLILAIDGFFLTKNERGNWIPKKGLLIAPNHTHECDATNIPIISIDIDPESDLGEWVLSHHLEAQQILDYPSDTLSSFDIDTFTALLKRQEWGAMRSMIEHLFSFQQTFEATEKDERIQKILDFIATHIDQKITTEMLMGVVFLSESRLLHLFKEKMGLPIRNYILWYRLKIVLELFMAGDSLTAAAHQAGFSDQAHMSRTFVKMIGVPPSALSKNSKFVQVSFPQ